MTLKPGEESELSFTTHMMQGMEGPHVFIITVISNDPAEPETQLRVSGDFEPAGGGDDGIP